MTGSCIRSSDIGHLKWFGTVNSEGWGLSIRGFLVFRVEDILNMG